MHHLVQARVGRVDARTGFTSGRVDETVCTCDPGVHWTRSSSPNDVEGPPGPSHTTVSSVVELATIREFLPGTHTTDVAAMPPGEWLGSEADDGRAKLR
jgi:hypothetical protein